jgi:pimeloyl-ACP methyl ester carboxylesterase
MAIVRFSVLGDIAYAPSIDGTIDMTAYDRDRRSGCLQALRQPSLVGARDNFRHFMDTAVRDATKKLPADGPVILFVHGFLFDPKAAISPKPEETDNPHGRVYHFQVNNESEEQRHHTSSWPKGLGIKEDDKGKSGLALAFGWQSQPGFASSLIQEFQNFYARAYDKAGLSAWILVNVIRELNKVMPDRQIDIFCHSLGSRVVLRAIAIAAKLADERNIGKKIAPLIPRIGRVVILGGAEYVVEAQLMQRRLLHLLDLHSGDEKPYTIPHFYNFVSRENDVLDTLAENFGVRTFGNSQVVGHNGLGIRGKAPNWIDLQIDSPVLQEWMKRRGFEVSGDRPDNVWDHWYYYTFRGNMKLYDSIFRDRAKWTIEQLRADTDPVPEGVAMKWWNFGD